MDRKVGGRLQGSQADFIAATCRSTFELEEQFRSRDTPMVGCRRRSSKAIVKRHELEASSRILQPRPHLYRTKLQCL